MKLKLKEFVLENESGGKVTLSFDASFAPEDMLKIIKKLQNETPTSEEKPKTIPPTTLKIDKDFDSLTIREKLEMVVNQIKYGWFTSDHIRELYQYHFHEEIKPSTVSTYLARMFKENSLERRGSRARREYRLAESEMIPIEYLKEI
jgi:hypothetical protein